MNDNKTCVVSCRVDYETKRRLDQEALVSGMSLSDVVRCAIESKRPPLTYLRELEAFIATSKQAGAKGFARLYELASSMGFRAVAVKVPFDGVQYRYVTWTGELSVTVYQQRGVAVVSALVNLVEHFSGDLFAGCLQGGGAT